MSRWIDKVTVGATLDRAAERFADLEALAFKGQRWTFAELKADCDHSAI